MGTIEEVYLSSRDEVACIKGKVLERHKDKFCLYHNAAGHTIASCFDLKDEIESLIWDRHLCKYRNDEGGPQARQTNRIKGEIHVIAGGSYPGGESQRSMKSYAREAKQKPSELVLQMANSPSLPR